MGEMTLSLTTRNRVVLACPPCPSIAVTWKNDVVFLGFDVMFDVVWE